MAMTERPPQRQRGSSLIEVLVATVVLTLAFLFVSGDMIASTQAEKQAADRSITINMANYLLDFMRQDPNFWSGSEESGGVWSGAPSGSDPCGNAWPAYNDSMTTPAWHPMPVCVGSPFANVASHGTFNFMWQAQEQTDVNAANLTVWIQAQTTSGGGSEVFEINQLNRNDPQPNTSGFVPPSPSPPPSPTPTPSHTPPPSPTPTPSHTPPPSPTPTPSHTATPHPSPTPTPSPTAIV